MPETGAAPAGSAGASAAAEEASCGGAESAQPAQGGQSAPDGAAQAAKKIAELEAQKADFEDKYLRKSADFENFRKRMFREKEETRMYATTELLVDLVSLLDDFDRAIASSETGKDWKTLHDGVQMIQKAFLSKLEGHYGLKRYSSAGEPFDPNRHEAMYMEKREGIDQAIVLEDLMKGYSLHDRIIRPAKVKVAMPSGAQAGGQQPAAPEAGGAESAGEDRPAAE